MRLVGVMNVDGEVGAVESAFNADAKTDSDASDISACADADADADADAGAGAAEDDADVAGVAEDA
jgi:hypothetical protein